LNFFIFEIFRIFKIFKIFGIFWISVILETPRMSAMAAMPPRNSAALFFLVRHAEQRADRKSSNTCSRECAQLSMAATLKQKLPSLFLG